MLGTCSRDGIPIKKPWTVATTIPELGTGLMKYHCDGSHEHAEGRGVDLKLTELYTWKFVDKVHASLQPHSAASRIALPCGLCAVLTLVVSKFKLQSQEERKRTWKGLPWIPVACRTFQGTQQSVVEGSSDFLTCQMFVHAWSRVYTPDKLDQTPSSWPRFNFEPKNSPMFEQFHVCSITVVTWLMWTVCKMGWFRGDGRSPAADLTIISSRCRPGVQTWESLREREPVNQCTSPSI